jgi:hypothetical protein
MPRDEAQHFFGPGPLRDDTSRRICIPQVGSDGTSKEAPSALATPEVRFRQWRVDAPPSNGHLSPDICRF